MPPIVFHRAHLSVAHPVLDLGEGLPDQIEIRRVRRQEPRPGAHVADRPAASLPLWTARLSGMTRSPGRSVGTRCCSTHAWKAGRLIGPSKTHGALSPSRRRPARKVRVRQRPCGAKPFRRCPFGAHPRSGAMLVLIQVSSTNTSRSGSSRRRSVRHRARLRATAARICSSANCVFLEAQALAGDIPEEHFSRSQRQARAAMNTCRWIERIPHD